MNSAQDTITHRCAALWFEDATFIFQAESTLFRVYGGMLTARSSVFADILSIQQPADRDLMDGCNFVCLPDPAEKVECFFQALFNSKYVMCSRPSGGPIDAVLFYPT